MIYNKFIQHCIRLIFFLSTVSVLVLGFAAILGQQIEHPIVKQIDATYFPMVYDSALSFCLASIGLLSGFYQKQNLAKFMAALVAAISISTFIQVFLQTDWKIIQQLLGFLVSLNPAYLGKTNCITALCFLLISIVIWNQVGIKKAAHSRIIFSIWVGVLIPSFGLLSLFGYVIRFYPDNRSLGLLDPMATNTATGMILMGISIVSLIIRASQYYAIDLKKYTPILITVFISFVSLLFWRFLITKQLLKNLTPTLAIIAISKELGASIIVGIAVYSSQTARRYAKNAHRLHALTKATLEAAAAGILVVDKREKIVDCNQKLMQMWQIPPSLQQESNFNKIVDFTSQQLKHKSVFSSVLKELKRYPEMSSRVEIYLKNGSVYEFQSFPQRMNQQLIGRVYSFHNITHLKHTENQLLHQATHDTLTGLSNRFLLLDHIEKAIAHAKRNQNFLALLFFDLDRFKLINDSLGHAVGDSLLQAVAERLKAITRQEDTLARLGGDEFVLLATNLVAEKNAVIIAKRYLQELSHFYQIEGHQLHVNCSLGISLYPKNGRDPSTLLKNSDIAMYKAKKNQTRFQFYTTDMQRQILKRLTDENELRFAAEKNQLVLYYQPIIDLKSGKICATEALLRWKHPTKGLIKPGAFIPIAEETNIIISLGEWALLNACKQNKIWQDKGLLHARMSVNISSKQLQQPRFYHKIERILAETGLERKFLELELTESILAENCAQTTSILQQLKSTGAMLSIDDFGTGYSSLSYLKYLPIDKLKIDRSFIKDLPQNEDDKAIVLAIIAMAKNLDLKVLAEGIETLDQMQFLHANHCDEIQGIYFMQPLDAARYEKLIPLIHKKIATYLLNSNRNIEDSREELQSALNYGKSRPRGVSAE